MSETARIQPDAGILGAAASLVLVIGLATIAGAWAFQIFADLPPCPLCLQQRWPYYTALPLTVLVLALLYTGRAPRIASVLLAMAGLIFLAGAGLAAYHAGVEWKWWPGPTTCAGGGAPVATGAADLLRQLQTTRIVACDEAAWRLLGISLAGYNFLISLGLAVTALRAVFKANNTPNQL